VGRSRPPARRTTLFSPFLRTPFKRALEDGVIPADLTTIAGTWGAIHDTGELNLHEPRSIFPGIDGTDPDDLHNAARSEGGARRCTPSRRLRRYTPGCESARLRNFGMTLGIRDTRKIEAVYDMTEEDVRGQGRFEDSIGIFPEFIDGYGILILPTTGRYFQLPYRNLLPKGVRNLLVAGARAVAIGSRHAATATWRAVRCSGKAAGIAAALSVRAGCDLDAIRIEDVQRELDRQGVRYR